MSRPPSPSFRSHRRSHRRSRRRFAALLLALAALAAAAPADADLGDVEVSAAPSAPTWRDRVTVEVTGTSNCFVSLVDSRVLFEIGTGSVLEVELEEACLIDPPQFVPFAVDATFDDLLPGDYLVRAVDFDGEVLATGALTVFKVADLVIVPPTAPPTDDAPFTFFVEGISTGCLLPQEPVVEGNAIVSDFPRECPILPPGSSVVTYEYTVGPLAAGDYEIQIFDNVHFPPLAVAKQPIRVYDAEGCVPSETALCLNGDRFRAEVEWREFGGGSGAGTAIPLADRDDTGLFWFFDEENVELTVKVLDGCLISGHFWLFVAASTNVEYTLRVTDTATGAQQVVANALGVFAPLHGDTTAFDCP